MSTLTLFSSFGSAFVLGLAVIIHYYYKNAFSYWRKRGVKGPRPYPLVGNLAHIIFNRKICLGWMQEYGKVYGIYEGNKPAIVVADAAALRQMCIKDFDKMPDHKVLAFMSELQRSFIFLSEGEIWKKRRSVLSPTFTSGKMRRMYKLMDVCGDDLLLAFREQLQSGKRTVHLKDLFSLFTMDAIASCCYGLKMERYSSSVEGGLKKAATRDNFVKDALELFEFRVWRLLVMLCFGEKTLKRFNFNFIPISALDGFSSRIQEIINRRQGSGRHFDDYLQILIDSNSNKGAKGASTHEDNSLDVKESHHAGSDEDHVRLDTDTKAESYSMSDIEVLSSATFLMIVGLETTATTLTHCFYALSYHPEIQEKLYGVVKTLAKYEGKQRHGNIEFARYSFDYDALTSCQYLDAVVSETLRCIPAVLQTDRMIIEDYHLVTHDLDIPKGTKIVLHLGDIMNDEDNWREPAKFDPERFMPGEREKIVPGSYCPFGLGPRHCLGMRFSLTETKLALAKILMEFKFEPEPGLTFPPVMKINFGLNGIKKPLVRVVRRESA